MRRNMKINYSGMLKDIQILVLALIFVNSYNIITKWFLGTLSGIFGILFVLVIIFSRNNEKWLKRGKNENIKENKTRN